MSNTELITCKPISTYEELVKWPKIRNGCRKYNVEKLNEHNLDDEYRNKVLVCHDMRNNYLEDRYLQGFNTSSDCYSFYHWNLIDTFIYFSHHFITIPPESWINAAHHNNVRILGTFITEWNDGLLICKKFLYDRNKINDLVDKLVNITLYYEFDGWLINIENKIENIEGVANLKYFVKLLTDKLRSINPNIYKVIWYDSVIKTGELKWQNELNELNKEFLDVCDGFFVNYTWTAQNLKNTKEMSAHRYRDIYVGVDVFGRGCLGSGGFNCNVAFDEIRKYDLGVALFAPGWLHECNNPKEFYQNSEKFWGLLKELTSSRRLNKLPIITTFNHGCAHDFYINGKLIPFAFNFDNGVWFNLNMQSLLPVISKHEPLCVDWCFNDAFFGGNCIDVKSSKNPIKLFDLNLELEKNCEYIIEYVFKFNNDKNNQFNDLKSQEQSYTQFYISLNYSINNSSGMKALKLNENTINNDELKIDMIEDDTSNAYEWRRLKFCLKTKSEVLKFESVNVINVYNKIEDSIKLGKFSFIDARELNQIRDSVYDLVVEDCKLNTFQLAKHVYLNVDIKWRKPDGINTKFYLVFIDENQNKADSDFKHELKLRLLGITRVERYLTCLKLNKNFKCDLGAHKGLSFDIFIKPIDVCLFTIKNQDIESDKTVLTARIFAKSIRQHSNEAELNFIDEIIYDYENFD